MVKNFKKLLVLSSILVLISSASSFADMNVSRISGRDRYETALKVQQKYFDHADGNLAIIASGKDFRTALYGSYMANALKVPFFVNPTSGLNKSIINELNRLNVKKVYLMGNVKTLNKNIENHLRTTGVKVERFYDGRLYNTGNFNRPFSIENHVGFKLSSEFPTEEYHSILINDEKFPDMLSTVPLASTFARLYGGDLINYKNRHSNDDVENNEYFYIIGGENTISYKYKLNELGRRLFGENRYGTSIRIAEELSIYNSELKTIVLVDGTNYPDALASGTVATFENGAILLTQPNKLNENTRDFIEENNIEKVIIVGGEKSVSKNVENELRGL